MLCSGQVSMNIERKMDFIVENLAALTVSQQKTDRQMRGLQTLVKTGMRMLIDLQRSQKRTDERMAELAESQKELSPAKAHRRKVRTLAKLFKSRHERTQEEAQLGRLAGLVYTEV